MAHLRTRTSGTAYSHEDRMASGNYVLLLPSKKQLPVQIL
jgi:hypothetical protein